MLFDFEKGCNLIDPEDLKDTEIYKKFKRVHGENTRNAVFRRLHEFLNSQRPSQASNLVWVRLAKMMGRQSPTPHADICFVEDRVEEAVGDGKEFLMLCGILFMIAIAERPEKHWLTSKVDSDEYDIQTGKLISWRGYWIKTDFLVPERYRHFSLEDLKKKFR